jgi:hypothetical protein
MKPYETGDPQAPAPSCPTHTHTAHLACNSQGARHARTHARTHAWALFRPVWLCVGLRPIPAYGRTTAQTPLLSKTDALPRAHAAAQSMGHCHVTPRLRGPLFTAFSAPQVESGFNYHFPSEGACKEGEAVGSAGCSWRSLPQVRMVYGQDLLEAGMQSVGRHWPVHWPVRPLLRPLW